MSWFQKKWLQELVLVMAFAGMVVVYTAPTKYKYGDTLMLCLWVGFAGWLPNYLKREWPSIRIENFNAWTFARSAFGASARWHLPILVQALFLLYLWGMQFELETLYKILWGWSLYITAFCFSVKFGVERVYCFVGKILIVAGVVHLSYMYLDLWLAYADGRLALSSGPRWGWLEGMKDTSRVGRKYLSIALTNMLLGTLILVVSRRDRKSYFIYFLSFVALMSLVMIDARSAYVAILGAFAMVYFVKWREVSRVVFGFARRGGQRWAVLVLAAAVLAVAYDSGKSRWAFLGYSFSAAYSDVFTSNQLISQRPYVDRAYWSEPILDVPSCYANHEFRCEVDQSAYFRLAGLLEGVKQAFLNPRGVGGADGYMGRIWGVEGDDSKFQRTDSEFVFWIVGFGFVGLLCYILILLAPLKSIYRKSGTTFEWAGIFLSVILMAIMIRGVYDTLDEGIWRCMMLLWGFLAGVQYLPTKGMENHS